MDNYVITVTRQFASMGRTISQKLSEDMGIEFYDRDIVEQTAKRMGEPIATISKNEEAVSPRFFNQMYPLGMDAANIQEEIYRVETNIIRDLTSKNSCIIVGRNANLILKDHPRTLNVYIYAPFEARLKNCTDQLEMTPKNARQMIRDVDKAREKFRQRFAPTPLSPYDGFDLMIDSSKFGIDGTATIIKDVAKKMFF